MIQPPIFIGGMFKSGTSLLRAMIGQHPNIASGLETYWFDIDLPNLASADVQRRLDRLAEFYEFERADVLSMASQSPTSEVFLTALLRAYAERLGKTRWAEKTPGNNQHMDRIFAAWPDAKLVHIIRDPRDIYASLKQARKWDSIEEFSERWCRIVGAVERFRDVLDLNNDRYMELRYESLVLEPEKTTQKLFDFLDEDWSESVATFGGTPDDFDKVLSVTGKASTTLERMKQPLTSGRVGIWHQVLSDEEVDSLHAAVSEQGLLSAFLRIEEETPQYNIVNFSR